VRVLLLVLISLTGGDVVGGMYQVLYAGQIVRLLLVGLGRGLGRRIRLLLVRGGVHRVVGFVLRGVMMLLLR